MNPNKDTDTYNNKGIWIFIATVSILISSLTIICLDLNHSAGPLSPLWLTTATLIAALFLCPWRYWPGLIACSAFGLLFAYLVADVPIISGRPVMCITLAEAILGGYLLRWVLNEQDPLNGILSWLMFFLVGVILVPLLGALGVGYFSGYQHGDFVQFVLRWFTSEALGILALTPVGLLCRRNALRTLSNPKAWLELLVLMLLILATCYFSLRYFPFPLVLIVLPLLIAAIRLPRFEAFCLFLLTTLVLYAVQESGLIKLDLPASTQLGMLLHIPLLMILIPANAMAMVMHAFRTERRLIEQSETRFRNAMEYSAIGMALVSLEGTWLQVNKSLCKFLGYSAQQLETLNFRQITHPDDLTSDLAQLDDLMAGRIESYTLEKRYIRSDQQIVWALLAVSLVRDRQNKPLYFISQIEDITEVKESETINRQLMERITLANEAGGVGIWEWDAAAEVMNWDKRMREIYGMRPDEQTSYDYWLSRVLEEDRPAALEAVRIAKEQSKPFSMVFRIRQTNGEIRHIRAYANMLKDGDNRVVRMIGVNLDITSEVRLTDALHEEKERLHIILDSIGDAVISVDRDLQVNFMNPVAESMTGWDQENAHGQHIDKILHISFGADGPPLPASIENKSLRPQDISAIDSVLVLNNRHGQLFDIHYSSTSLRNLQGETFGSVLIIEDVSESRQLLQQLSYNASHDVLTGLPNRASFEKHLETALMTASAQKREHALVFIDLDRFKEINDTAGHAAGDALLLELGLLMQDNLRQHDCLARLGGDEFGLILPDCSQADARPLVQRIIDAVNNYPFYWEDKLYRIGGSAGITMINQHNCHNKDVMSQADTACYTAKHSGRGRVQLFEMHQQIAGQTAGPGEIFSRDDLLKIINNDIQLLVKPVAPPQTLLSVSFYLITLAISRPTELTLSQQDLVAVAEKYRLLPAMDRWLMNQVFNVHGEAIADKGLVVALPFSLQGLSEPSLVEDLLRLAEHHRLLKNQALILNLNGNNFMRYYPAIAANLLELHQHGYQFMLDQFGGDLSAFNKLPVGLIDYVQLPNRFVEHVHSSQMDDIMVRIINSHIHRLQALSIAAPFNLTASLPALQDIGIDLAGKTAGEDTQPLSSMLSTRYFTIQ